MNWLRRTLRTLEREGIGYCLLRDGHHLKRFVSGGEVDVLVEKSQFRHLCDVLGRLGFVRLAAWGHWPHHFFVAYLEDSNGWLKLDVVTHLAYGRPSHALRSSLAKSCLERRRKLRATYVLSPEDELVTQLLHCVLDKKQFTPAQQKRLRTLLYGVTDPALVSDLLRKHWSPKMTWLRLVDLIDSESWQELLSEAKVIGTHLARRDRSGVLYRRVRDRVLRKLDNWTRIFRYRAPSVAIVAPDGAGKSTLISAIQHSFFFSSRSIYMGLYPKSSIDVKMRPRVRRNIKGYGTASLLMKQWSRYLAARYHQSLGRLVLFDRYTYDALLPTRQQISGIRRWRRQLLANACPAPDLVVLLNAPGDVLYSRKGEHCAAWLEQQRQSYLAMRQDIPQMVVVDATRDAERVCREVNRIIWRAYAQVFRRSRST